MTQRRTGRLRGHLASRLLIFLTLCIAEASRFFQILSGATNSVAIPRTLLGNYPSGS